MRVEYRGKAVAIRVPDDMSLEYKERAFTLAGKALLREETTAALKARIEQEGFDYDEIVKLSREARKSA